MWYGSCTIFNIYASLLFLSQTLLLIDYFTTNFSSTWGLRIHNLCISRPMFQLFYSICFMLQVNFCYFEAGENKQALVKLVACERWVSMRQCQVLLPVPLFSSESISSSEGTNINHLMKKLRIDITPVHITNHWCIEISMLFFYTDFFVSILQFSFWIMLPCHIC